MRPDVIAPAAVVWREWNRFRTPHKAASAGEQQRPVWPVGRLARCSTLNRHLGSKFCTCLSQVLGVFHPTGHFNNNPPTIYQLFRPGGGGGGCEPPESALRWVAARFTTHPAAGDLATHLAAVIYCRCSDFHVAALFLITLWSLCFVQLFFMVQMTLPKPFRSTNTNNSDPLTWLTVDPCPTHW